MQTYTYLPESTDPTILLISTTRLYAGDTNVREDMPDFSDQELTIFLARVGNNAELAAARALRTLANDAARMAVATKRGTRGNDETSISDKILATAAELELRAVVPPSVGEYAGTPFVDMCEMDRWFRCGP